MSHVSEAYSPERVCSVAERAGTVKGLSMDLTTVDPDDGLPRGRDRRILHGKFHGDHQSEGEPKNLQTYCSS